MITVTRTVTEQPRPLREVVCHGAEIFAARYASSRYTGLARLQDALWQTTHMLVCSDGNRWWEGGIWQS